MSHFLDMVRKMKDIISSFSGPVNIIICHLDLDSLVAALAMKYYVSHTLGCDRFVRIFYNGKIRDSLFQSVCEHFSIFSNGVLNSITEFKGEGNNIFIDYIGDSNIIFPTIKHPSVIIGRIGREIVGSHDPEIITFSSENVSASSIVFNILSLSDFLKKRDEKIKLLVFMLAIAIQHDVYLNGFKSSYNLGVLGRTLGYVGGIAGFHDEFEKLPNAIKMDLRV